MQVHYGDQPAAVLLELAKELAAQEGASICPIAAQKSNEASYVDDSLTGGSPEELNRLVGNVSKDSDGKPVYDGTLSQIYENVGLKIKNIVRSSDDDDAAIKRSGEAFLGYKWIPKDDVLKFFTAVSINKRVNGIKSGPNLTLDNLQGESLVFTPQNLL